ncbi:hypothetical protein LCGC14_1549630 [marine sediment metagenome]|uniref:Uncharacterized protein n=1 Tax=marine sediment metagenome TaxID=412755 RepID=A0A0F9JBP8_9ZZZZ
MKEKESLNMRQKEELYILSNKKYLISMSKLR